MTEAVEYAICTELPLRIESEANRHEHWRTRAMRARNHRDMARVWMQRYERPMNGPERITITLTRIAPRELDSDNLASGFKAARDGIADWLGIDDGDKRLRWEYDQRKGAPRHYAAEIVVRWSA